MITMAEQLGITLLIWVSLFTGIQYRACKWHEIIYKKQGHCHYWIGLFIS